MTDTPIDNDRGRGDASPVLLYLDFETTGTSTHDPNILEVAWQFTTLDQEPLTELHTALCVIGAGAKLWRSWVRDGSGEHDRPASIPQFVLDMHEHSGLADDHRSGNWFIGSWIELRDRIQLDWPLDGAPDDDGDIVDGSFRTAHVAGMGVAAFDLQILRRFLQDASQFPLHYRPFDTSNAEFVVHDHRSDIFATCTVIARQDAVGATNGNTRAIGLVDDIHRILTEDAFPVRILQDAETQPITHRAATDVIAGRLLAVLLAAEKYVSIPWVWQEQQ